MTNKNGCIDISYSTIGTKKGANWDNLFQHIPKLSQNSQNYPNIRPKFSQDEETVRYRAVNSAG
jgi:hypothetical protein